MHVLTKGLLKDPFWHPSKSGTVCEQDPKIGHFLQSMFYHHHCCQSPSSPLNIRSGNFSRFPIGPTVPHRHGHESFVHDAYNVALAWLSYFVPYTITNGEYIHIYMHMLYYIYDDILYVYMIYYIFIYVWYIIFIYIYIYDMYIWYIIYVWYIYIWYVIYVYDILCIYDIIYIYVYESYCTQENQSSLVFQKLPVKW